MGYTILRLHPEIYIFRMKPCFSSYITALYKLLQYLPTGFMENQVRYPVGIVLLVVDQYQLISLKIFDVPYGKVRFQVHA